MTSLTYKEALNELDDRRIKSIKPLIPPSILIEEYPLSLDAAQTVASGRKSAEEIVKQQDDRLLVVVGPCSIHDVRSGLEYARKLAAYAESAKQDLHIVMRVYFEKPRTTVGWKGLINDPNLNGSFQINKGLRLARGFLLEVNLLGLPAATEFLDTISPQYTADLISWGAIGARTTESQVHRELSSGLSMPIGFKNGTDGSISIAVDAIKAASSEHVFLSVTKQGISAIVETNGNDACHLILRGANTGPNYSPEHVASVSSKLTSAGLPARIMIDCSHGNSEKKHENQIKVIDSISSQLAKGDENGCNIFGVMIESNLVQGKQSIPPQGPTALKYGQSITDACVDWDTTVQALEKLREGVRKRRKSPQASRVFQARLSRCSSSQGVNDHFLQQQDGGKAFNDDALATLGNK
ncbi:probable 3-deoxy-D-arabino-heptulosonate 7-phosphate (DAHP) synthase isoenzyme [Ustilago bromivora]|uniref:3-deoxy-7-phosphoheptulonate synthase n=1 Tax=Ustilago bromivora TaxID=307758 RepID=A0A1K0G5T5_9BASI|nr:probable 3-deoxy-D-arabino-heptulosonate 7-phosphate (DAHP) synthase isoenzyme [Ustilago bromivora]SYW83186.1 probable 3-deoxy-D-arabino-heptulosonate 7-phosphate (DAHP) synthase isoenzyme [Ustilago bromivora]